MHSLNPTTTSMLCQSPRPIRWSRVATVYLAPIPARRIVPGSWSAITRVPTSTLPIVAKQIASRTTSSLIAGTRARSGRPMPTWPRVPITHPRTVRDTLEQSTCETPTDLVCPHLGPCVPGTYGCVLNPSTNTPWVTVCGWNQKLQYSSDCGDQNCLAREDGVAHCWNKGDQWNTNSASVSRRDEPEQVSPDLTLSGNCSPGSYACGWRNGTQTSWVITCDQSGNWVWSSDCGRGMECDYANGDAHCVPQKSTIGAREELSEVPADLAPTASCRPGEFGCAWSKDTMTDWTIVCDQSGKHWLWSSDCGQGMKCEWGGGVAHCVLNKVLFVA